MTWGSAEVDIRQVSQKHKEHLVGLGTVKFLSGSVIREAQTPNISVGLRVGFMRKWIIRFYSWTTQPAAKQNRKEGSRVGFSQRSLLRKHSGMRSVSRVYKMTEDVLGEVLSKDTSSHIWWQRPHGKTAQGSCKRRKMWDWVQRQEPLRGKTDRTRKAESGRLLFIHGFRQEEGEERTEMVKEIKWVKWVWGSITWYFINSKNCRIYSRQR